MIGIGASALVAAVVGYLLEPAWGWMLFSVALLAMLLYHLRKRAQLMDWLEHGGSPEPPRARGVWDELHALLHRSRREAARREAELVHAVTRWRQAARALPDGVVLLDGDRIAWCNDTASLHLGIDPVRDLDTSITHLVRIPEFLEYLGSGEYGRPIQVQDPHSDRVLSLLAIAYGEDQRLVLSRDVTQFRKVEQMRREFVANVSHELRTPLTVVAGFLETLREEKDPEAARRYLGLMSDQARRMQRLVEDLLTLSALESSPPPPMEEPIEMRGLLERLGAEARALSGGRHRIEVEGETGIDLRGSEKELSSAFGNLVSNAIRYTPEGGTVRLKWHRLPDGAAFDVEDTGIGIAAEHIPRLTERFYRVDRGRSRETGGTGLGLAIVKHALARHGATLDIASTPGEGSRFSARFTGPRVREAASAAQA
ncbi:MAG TPA: phosphate regulon sensor histidine kinase PhoR [Usitatibacter sp.]|nr:phosphate regulon sensor histidine kinase PhoR [Usitatibacter sp.]